MVARGHRPACRASAREAARRARLDEQVLSCRAAFVSTELMAKSAEPATYSAMDATMVPEHCATYVKDLDEAHVKRVVESWTK
jgi:hypothetical protein